MNSLFSQISLFSSSILLKSARSIVGSSSIYGICSNSSCKSSLIKYPGTIKSSNLGSSALSRFGLIQCSYYSTKKVSTRKRKSTAETVVEDEKDAFFVVRKGDIVGVYKSLSDCQAQVGSSICEPPVSVYKGYSLPSKAEEHIVSRGLQNALYTIKASDLNDDLFGTLVPCPFEEPAASTGETSSIPQKRPPDAIASGNLDADCNPLTYNVPSNKLPKLDNMSCDSQTCVLEFNGTSRGNPGPAAAGAVLRTLNGSVICKIRQGLGRATYNVADYQALILGLKRALEMGYTSIHAKGDNELVCMQLQGLWKVKKQNMAVLHAEASKLKKKFTSFQISLVLKELNTDADKQANLGVALAKDAFFVVRKGDIVGVYKSLSDCQAQVGSSICEPPVSVYKGYSLPIVAEEHLVSRGLQNALYTIKASDLNDDLFGTLVPCPFKEPAASTGETSSKEIPQKRPPDAIGSGNLDADCNSLTYNIPSNKLPKLDNLSCDSLTCVLEFDGASKGNPGPAGAGAVLRTLNGSVICKIRQGLGTATCNVAEYRAVILGLKRALEMGYTSIQAKGDSQLVCLQLDGSRKAKSKHMADLLAEATILKKKFTSFKISHVLRGLNSDADAQANLGVTLANGQIQESLD